MSTLDMDAPDLRNAFGRFVTGVTVITTTLADGTRIGFTANSFASVSIDPPICRREAKGLAALLEAEHFAINFLAADQQDISRRFSMPVADRFAGLATTSGIGGVPLIAGCSASFECRKWSTFDAGDHVIFLGRVLEYRHEEKSPLVFFGGNYLEMTGHRPR
jgi:flavin reductase (DIM6/NTAB) family NADH-FMN oxidoreductase RutF